MAATASFAVHVTFDDGADGVLIIKAPRPQIAAEEALKRAGVAFVRKTKRDKAGREG